MSFGDCTKLKTPSNYHHSAGYTITNYWTLHSKQDLKQVWSVIITIYWLLIITLCLIKRNLERSLTSFNFVFIFTVKLIPSHDSFFFQIKSVSNNYSFNNERYNLSGWKSNIILLNDLSSEPSFKIKNVLNWDKHIWANIVDLIVVKRYTSQVKNFVNFFFIFINQINFTECSSFLSITFSQRWL